MTETIFRGKFFFASAGERERERERERETRKSERVKAKERKDEREESKMSEYSFCLIGGGGNVCRVPLTL